MAMTAPKPAASLNAGLLARKGAARPAMRSQLQGQLPQATAAFSNHHEDDLGWNDMGHDDAPAISPVVNIVEPEAPVPQSAPVPVVVQQQQILAEQIAPSRPAKVKLEAISHRAAFTLRLDAQRHLRLRLASAVVHRSAQQLVTDALDQFLASFPDLDVVAEQIKPNR